jgi:hypothetical protein
LRTGSISGVDYERQRDVLRAKQKQFGEDMLDYIDNMIENYPNQWLNLNEEWKGFLVKYELDKKEYSLKRFKKGLEIAYKTLDIDFVERKNQQNNEDAKCGAKKRSVLKDERRDNATYGWRGKIYL